MTRNPSIAAAAGPRVVNFDLPLPVAIFVGLSTYAALTGAAFLASVVACRMLQMVLQ